MRCDCCGLPLFDMTTVPNLLFRSDLFAYQYRSGDIQHLLKFPYKLISKEQLQMLQIRKRIDDL